MVELDESSLTTLLACAQTGGDVSLFWDRVGTRNGFHVSNTKSLLGYLPQVVYSFEEEQIIDMGDSRNKTAAHLGGDGKKLLSDVG